MGSWGIRIPTEEDHEPLRPPLPLHLLHRSHRETCIPLLHHRLRTEEDAVHMFRRHVLVVVVVEQICLLSWEPLRDGDGNHIREAVRSYMVPWNDAAILAPRQNLRPQLPWEEEDPILVESRDTYCWRCHHHYQHRRHCGPYRLTASNTVAETEVFNRADASVWMLTLLRSP
jgi:hypothetical protein